MDGQIDSQNFMESKREIAECDANIPLDSTTTPALPKRAISQKLLEHCDHASLDETVLVTAQDSGYNSSGSSTRHSPAETLSGGGDDGEPVRTRSRASSRTSISSIPASVLTNLPDGIRPTNLRDTQDYVYQPWDHHGPRTVHTIRQREGTFRKPSSVRAMQMHTEDEADYEYHLTPPKRRGSQRTSDFSIRSAGSSPFKRSPFYSPTATAGKPKVKKEYPLVLLHCTLLSPSLPVAGLATHPDRKKILSEVLPSVYWKRWKLLEEKIGSGVLRERGVLISHPEDMYDLLEERLLESLELQDPRLDHGHFLWRDETESDREDRLEKDDNSTEDEGDECPDCGGRILRHNTTRKWEVKVFAANGLMRAGAWAAAWKEMEKVDVEVGLWLPSDVRAELGKLVAEASSHIDNGFGQPLLQDPGNIPPEPPSLALTPTPQKAGSRPHVTQHRQRSPSPVTTRHRPQDDQKSESNARKPSEEIDLQTLLVNYVRVLANDRRNIAIVFLSMLVVFIAINSRSATVVSDLHPFPENILESTASSVVPLQEPEIQSWSERTNSRTLSVTVPDSTAVVAPSAEPVTFSSLDSSSGPPVKRLLYEPEEAQQPRPNEVFVENADLVSEVGQQEPPSENKPEKLSRTEGDTVYIESVNALSDMEAQEHSREIAPEESQPAAAGNSAVENAEFDSEKGEQQHSENTHVELPPTVSDTAPVGSVEIASAEPEQSSQASKNEPDEALPATAGTPSSDGSHDFSEAKETLQVSETAFSEEAQSSTVSVDDSINDLPLPLDEQHNQHEQIDETQHNEQLEQHEPSASN
ncbi:hypothetical protein ASPVEDRAFT_159139 [Aspergillus versicolor CBS 583.65]|uniref:Flavoprotein oxygenase n=1 Tax=Aspergillus versicolor CBS 583.65 TaxID=1036611 RepID=A0A1L9P6D2_ASPVE|nr:uncharacterized protein ASPVEDRAFT_159139 [Aspergillus versicolor CBS 583.65]OJI97081.1 hypothetical protein ASPVEDRAFT_159139 [Aspergillus versicolor CBS 583.65]